MSGIGKLILSDCWPLKSMATGNGLLVNLLTSVNNTSEKNLSPVSTTHVQGMYVNLRKKCDDICLNSLSLCQCYQWPTCDCKYLLEFSKKLQMVLSGVSRVRERLIQLEIYSKISRDKVPLNIWQTWPMVLIKMIYFCTRRNGGFVATQTTFPHIPLEPVTTIIQYGWKCNICQKSNKILWLAGFFCSGTVKLSICLDKKEKNR